MSLYLDIFLLYLTFHLLLEDFIFVFQKIRTPRPSSSSPPLHNNEDETRPLTPEEQRTITTVVIKICDITLICVERYFDAFIQCWTSTLMCLEHLLIAYMNLLQSISTVLTQYPTCKYTCTTSVLCLGIVAIIIWILTPYN